VKNCRAFRNPHEYLSGRDERGQIVVEYVLILIVVLSLALLISKTMVSRDENSPGFVIQKWNALINAIGKDKADGID
jgi:hypothetical protein